MIAKLCGNVIRCLLLQAHRALFVVVLFVPPLPFPPLVGRQRNTLGISSSNASNVILC